MPIAQRKQIRHVLVGFAIPITGLFFLVGVASVLEFRPGGEFASGFETAAFYALVWGLVVLFSCLGLALSMFVLSRWVPRIPIPTVLGMLAGIAISGLFAFGGIPPFALPFALPGRATLLVRLFGGGVVVGLSVSVIAALFAKVPRRTVA